MERVSALGTDRATRAVSWRALVALAWPLSLAVAADAELRGAAAVRPAVRQAWESEYAKQESAPKDEDKGRGEHFPKVLAETLDRHALILGGLGVRPWGQVVTRNFSATCSDMTPTRAA